jgi:hypothetical protein
MEVLGFRFVLVILFKRPHIENCFLYSIGLLYVHIKSGKYLFKKKPWLWTESYVSNMCVVAIIIVVWEIRQTQTHYLQTSIIYYFSCAEREMWDKQKKITGFPSFTAPKYISRLSHNPSKKYSQGHVSLYFVYDRNLPSQSHNGIFVSLISGCL